MNHRAIVIEVIDTLNRLRRSTYWSMLGVMVVLLGCGGGVVHRVNALPTPPQNGGFLKIKGGNPSTLVYLNGSLRGSLKTYPRQTLLIKSGKYRLELRQRGFASAYYLIEIKNTKPVEIEGSLIALPPDPPDTQH